ncbi:hypothetical protein H257_00820 [Aphanomyces astaci]|uniref:Uncharacterized protein n=1 Tax=Aphanomyces astaci TaxID=112090 RepID=W4HE88_APHAT|nr:hypothetical protein H257_00820 [Aphanomyces astaci]ETV89609.1 hypothetical protein H257_00820 [Aphanomyces astaci]|eukprot:XP_009822009.1 hypothetical protein H257_00820 [Aphanomyces astaci]
MTPQPLPQSRVGRPRILQIMSSSPRSTCPPSERARAFDRAEKRAAARYLIQQQPARCVKDAPTTWNSSPNSKRVIPARALVAPPRRPLGRSGERGAAVVVQ